MNTNTTTQTNTSVPVVQGGKEKEVTNQHLLSKLLELEKKIEAIQKKLMTPLIN